ncbi:hypothetical protein Tco_1158041 [Tanacetum coccineum]
MDMSYALSIKNFKIDIGSRRSGMGKGKGQVFEENTIDDVIDTKLSNASDANGNFMTFIHNRWDCGLEGEGKKQNTQLGCLRKKYDGLILQSECYVHWKTIIADLVGTRAANVRVKPIKVPIRN